MRNGERVLFFAVVLFFARALLFAADGAQIRTSHYEIVSDSGGAEQTGRRLEALFEVYNRVFMFDPAGGVLPLKVRVFADTEEYNSFVRSSLAPANPGALYLHYAQSDKRILLIDQSDAEALHSLPYQAFIQYLRSFVSRPPLWMQKGFAAFFSSLSFSPEGKLEYEENLGWLQVVKNMQNRPSLEDILLAEGGGQEYSSLACSLVSFLLNSGKEEYTRSLTDSLMILSSENTAAQNASAVSRRLLLGRGAEQITRDYEQYVNSRRTFTQLIAEGQRAYSSGDKTGAELSFRAAIEVKHNHFVPYYYLGLLAYEANKFDAAQEFYRTSLENGADPAIALYAMGINAAGAGKAQEAVDYLRRAAQASPAQYGQKTEKLISQLTSK